MPDMPINDRLGLAVLGVLICLIFWHYICLLIEFCTTPTESDMGLILPIDDDEREPDEYLNRYHCISCGIRWSDVWECMCNDKCSGCNKEIEPYDSLEMYHEGAST